MQISKGTVLHMREEEEEEEAEEEEEQEEAEEQGEEASIPGGYDYADCSV